MMTKATTTIRAMSSGAKKGRVMRRYWPVSGRCLGAWATGSPFLPSKATVSLLARVKPLSADHPTPDSGYLAIMGELQVTPKDRS